MRKEHLRGTSDAAVTLTPTDGVVSRAGNEPNLLPADELPLPMAFS
jgi:hypothetical protein